MSDEVRKLTLAELNHLHTLLEEAKAEGSYYGPREQYYARTDRLIEWCEEQIQQHREAILARRRAVMPDYDRKLEEWLS